MRAAREAGSRKSVSFGAPPRREVRSKNLKNADIHISGAEGIYEEKDIQRACNKYIKRALTHPRGKPDEIRITMEKIKNKPLKIPLLPVQTVKCGSPDEARDIISQKLFRLGISKTAVVHAFKVLQSRKTMRGASLMLMQSGKRVEPDKERGVRVSRLGIEKATEKKLSQELLRANINTTTVKEALILASKVASCPSVIAEICISDDPDYTTGYVASNKFGYLRIPNIKKRGEMHGGRVLFIRDIADVNKIIAYLEKRPVVVKLK